jgi:hypothetical protein
MIPRLVPGADRENLSLSAYEALLLASVNGSRTNLELANRTGLSEQVVDRALDRLFVMGVIRLDASAEAIEVDIEFEAAPTPATAPATEPEPEPEFAADVPTSKIVLPTSESNPGALARPSGPQEPEYDCDAPTKEVLLPKPVDSAVMVAAPSPLERMSGAASTYDGVALIESMAAPPLPSDPDANRDADLGPAIITSVELVDVVESPPPGKPPRIRR